MSISERLNPDRKEIREKVGETPYFYTNSAYFQVSPFDFVIDLGLIKEASADVLRIEELVRILMSPVHAKLFANLFARNVAEYEKTYGRIPLPPEIEPQS